MHFLDIIKKQEWFAQGGSYLKIQREVVYKGKRVFLAGAKSPRRGRKAAAKKPFSSPFSPNPYGIYRTSKFWKKSEIRPSYLSVYSCLTMKSTTPKIRVRNSCSAKKKFPCDCFKKAMRNKSERFKKWNRQNRHFKIVHSYLTMEF